MSNPVSPGPFPSEAPQPIEIDCISVEKVYASCSQTVNLSVSFPEDDCTGPYTCSLDLKHSNCTVGAVTASGTDSINNITFVVTAVMNITFANNVTITKNAYTTVTVPLYNPDGTTPDCVIQSGSCSVVELPNGMLTATATLCLLLETTAQVQMLIPTYGFCIPSPCEVSPLPPCPPAPPPQQT